MKKIMAQIGKAAPTTGITLLLLLVFFTGNSIVFGQSASLYVTDPDTWSWNDYNPVVKQAEMVVSPRGVYFECDLYITFSSDEIPVNDSLEIYYDFSLPDNSFVHDSWLWVGDSIMQAYIMDRWQARDIYEDIVRRQRRDPSILTKSWGNYYDMMIYPLTDTDGRKIKISFSIPATVRNGKISCELPIELMQPSSATLSNEFTFYFLEDDSFGSPSVSVNGTDTSGSLSKEGRYQKMSIATSGLEELSAEYSLPNDDGYFFADQQKDDESFFQLQFNMKELFSIEKDQQYVIAMAGYDDYEDRPGETEYDYDDVAGEVMFKGMSPGLKDMAAYFMDDVMGGGDQYNFFYFNNGKIYQLNTDWESLPENSSSVLNSIATTDIMTTTQFISQIQACQSFIINNGGAGEVMLFANWDYSGTYTDARNLAAEMDKYIRDDITVNIIGYGGNEYNIYRAIANYTGGDFYSIYSYYSSSSVQGYMETIYNTGDMKISSLDIDIEVEDGFVYDLSQLHEESPYMNTDRIYVGKIYGTGSLELKVTGFLNDTPFVRTKSLNKNFELTDNKTNKIWAGCYINHMEDNSGYYYYDGPSLSEFEVDEIIGFSIDHRVLSRYTAFLALEPSDTVRACPDCEYEWATESDMSDDADDDNSFDYDGDDEFDNDGGDEEDANYDGDSDEGSAPSNVNENEAPKARINLYPNPFSDELSININTNGACNEVQVSVRIYNAQGQLVRSLSTSCAEDMVLHWDGKDENGQDMPAGLYYLRILINDQEYSLKAVKQ